MTITTSGRKNLEQQLKELFEQPFDAEAQVAIIAEIRMSVKQYENRYGMPSDRIHDAIDAGELIEDLDVGHWIFQYDLLCDLRQSAGKD